MAAKRGRPSKYSEELADKICEGVARGTPLVHVCAENKIGTVAVYDWLAKYEDFANKYTRAKINSAEHDANRIEEIAEGVLDKRYEPNAARVAIDAIKWAAGHKKPKKYGDRVQHDGEVGLKYISMPNKKDVGADVECDDAI